MPRSRDMFHLMEVFSAVVQAGSFSAAAMSLGMKTSSVSKAVSKLEDSLGTTLLIRSTRTMRLSDAGTYFYDECQQLLQKLATVENTVNQRSGQLVGKLCVTASVAVGEHLLGPLLPGFMKAHPGLAVELRLSDSELDLFAEDIDIALRSTPSLKSSSLYSKLISTQRRVLVAAPAYLDTAPSLETAADLQQHKALIFKAGKLFDRWTLKKGRERHQIWVDPALTSNNYASLVAAARAGAGIANVFEYLVKDDLAKGQLCQVLTDYEQTDQNIFALYSQKRSTIPKVDAFLAYLKACFPKEPDGITT